MPALALKSTAAEPHSNRHVMVVCTGESCVDAGAKDLLAELKERRREAHGDLRVGSSRCLGHCQAAPAMVEDGKVLGWVSCRRIRAELLRLGVM
jgi:NADH:ubiquinone oxidoreductase subunit E